MSTTTPAKADQFGNRIAQEGVSRCDCGCKYWEQDHCTDCGEEITRTFAYEEETP